MSLNDQLAASREIGNNLRSLRLQNGQSQASTAQLLGVSPQQVQKYESGSNRISAAALLVLSQNWNTPVHLFFPDARGIDREDNILRRPEYVLVIKDLAKMEPRKRAVLIKLISSISRPAK